MHFRIPPLFYAQMCFRPGTTGEFSALPKFCSLRRFGLPPPSSWTHPHCQPLPPFFALPSNSNVWLCLCIFSVKSRQLLLHVASLCVWIVAQVSVVCCICRSHKHSTRSPSLIVPWNRKSTVPSTFCPTSYAVPAQWPVSLSH